MNRIIKVIQEAPDKLSMREWRFKKYDCLVICLYSIWDYERIDTRRKYKLTKAWTSYERTSRHWRKIGLMNRIEPPEVVKEEARNQILAELTFLD